MESKHLKNEDGGGIDYIMRDDNGTCQMAIAAYLKNEMQFMHTKIDGDNFRIKSVHSNLFIKIL